MKFKESVQIATKIKEYVKKNKKIANSVKINNKEYTKNDCLYALSTLF